MSNQTKTLYSAENALARLLDNSYDQPLVNVGGSTLVVSDDMKFGSLEAIQSYVDRILGKGSVKVLARRGHAKATYSWGEISIPMMNSGRWAQRELVVLHEIAHHKALGDGHEAKFAQSFLSLVSENLGSQAAFILQVLFHESGVKCA